MTPSVLFVDTDEPSGRGIVGVERMRLAPYDINTHVDALAGRLGTPNS